MSRLVRNYGGGVWAHYCPGCKALHLIQTGTDRSGLVYSFNGDERCPTFMPSLNWSKTPIKINGQRQFITCHYNIVSGWIQYVNDCGHEFAGQKIAMQPIPDSLWTDDDLL